MRDPASLANHIRFGVFEVDLRTGELRKQGLKLKLQIQPFKILAMLLERPGELVTREEIREKLWPADTFIDFEHSVNSSIKKLREVLCDDAEKPRYIETLPRRGYRFIAAVETARRAVSTSMPVDVGAGLKPAPTLLSTGGYARRAVTAVVQGALEAHRGETRWRRLAVAGLALAVLALGLALLFTFNLTGLRDRLMSVAGARHPDFAGTGGVPPPKIESIAVLPLENLSHDPEQEYFADGMTDELIATLAKIGSLRVISRTSVMRYKGTKKPLPEIARELNVDGIVEGSVLRAGNRVRVTAQLLHAPTDRHLWAESYESDLSDVLVLQGEVARAIGEAIRINVTPQEQARLTATRTVNPEAHEAYLKGHFLYTKSVWGSGSDPRIRQNLDNAMEYFQLALKDEPNYAPAYVGMSHIWLGRGEEGYVPPREALPKAKAAALKALELDEGLAEAHEALANTYHFLEWDWAAAEKEYKRAIELDPNSAEIRARYMALLHIMRRPLEAKAQIARALELDPLNPRVRFWYGIHLEFSREYDAVITEAREWLKMYPDSDAGHGLLGFAFRQKGMLEEAVEEEKKCHARDPEYVQALDRGYARGGYRGAWRALTALNEAREKGTSSAPACNALPYIFTARNDQAIKCLEREYEWRRTTMVFLGVYPEWDPLRSDPRFKDLLRRMNLPP